MKASIQINRIIRIHLLFFILILLPTCSYSIQAPKGDTTFVLAISHFEDKVKWEAEKPIHYWEKKKRVSYVYPGTVVDLRLAGGAEIKQGKILKIEKESIVVDRQRVMISEIHEMKLGEESQATRTKIKGVFLLLIGIVLAGGWIAFFFYSFGGMDFSDAPGTFLGVMAIPVLIAAMGINTLRKSNLHFNFQNLEKRLASIPLTSLPKRIQKKLARRFFIN